MVVRHSVQDLIRETGRFVIDGSMGTALEDKGANLNNALWTAAILCNQPELVKEVHLDYFRAGADCGITCSYQATIPGLMKQGMSEDAAEELIVKSVEIFREARDEWWNNKEKGIRCVLLASVHMELILQMVLNIAEIMGSQTKRFVISISAVWSFFGTPVPIYCFWRRSQVFTKF